MPYALTTDSRVSCPATGTVSTSGQSKLKIAGGRALRKDGVAGRSIANCTTPNSNSSTRCSSVAGVTAGEATKLKVAGQPVLLDSFAGTSDGSLNTLTATANQSKLKAV